MRTLVLACVIVAGLAIAPLGGAGGWASVGFDPLPDGTAAGSTWSPTIYVKQHGVTPLAGLQPIVVIEDQERGGVEQFLTEPGSEAGVYSADVVFPEEGSWRVTIHSGFGESHVTYGPVAIGPPGAAGGRLDVPVAGLGVGVAVLALLGGLVVVGLRRSRRLTPASR